MTCKEMHIPVSGEPYHHYKGGEYQVVTVGRLSEQRDQIMVVYQSYEKRVVWIRPLGMWSETVIWPDLCDEDGPRFMRMAEYEERKAECDKRRAAEPF